MSPLNTYTALLLITSLTSASLLEQNRIVNGRPLGRARRQDLAGLPSWTSPDFCSETGQIKDMASLMVHPPPSKTLDYSSLCSEVLRPTNVVSVTSTLTGDSVITMTSTATVSFSTTTSEYSHSTTTALCARPSPSQRCGIPALGFSQNLLYYKNGLSGIECHELCLRDKECKSFQVVPQDNGYLKYSRCNVYRTKVDGFVSETGDGEAMFWDRGCEGLLGPGCARKVQKQKRDQDDSNCCRLERLPSASPGQESDDIKVSQQGSADLDSGDQALPLSVDEGIRVKRDDASGVAVQGALPLESGEEIRVERYESPDATIEDKLPVKIDEGIRVEWNEVPEVIAEDLLPSNIDESIRVEKRASSLEHRIEDTYKIPLNDQEESEEAARNGYILSDLNNDEVRPMKRDLPARTSPRSAKWYKIPMPGEEELHLPAPFRTGEKAGAVPGPGKRNSPSRPARTPSPRVPSWYKIPVPETEDTYRLPQAEPDSEVIRVEKREEGPADPLITPAPELPFLGAENELSEPDHDQGIRVEKRAVWTTPDFLKTFFPLFITLACSCLISSAAPLITSSVTEVVQTWNYTTTTSTKSEVYKFTEHPSWSTVYRTVG
ncbi:hypothetical protein BKA65DRAFT_592823 [Rhexocercosporidium sp. MPI-PUGE-AT-0058]|nr:hypothetical protein BKA65DRAFT_592823 [Rhexocercosporidium sp. MPI-PUGE-AT-0058]